MDPRFSYYTSGDYERAQYFYHFNFGLYPPYSYVHSNPPFQPTEIPLPESEQPVKVEENPEKEVKSEEFPIDENDEDVKKIFQHIRTSCRYDTTKELLKKF